MPATNHATLLVIISDAEEFQCLKSLSTRMAKTFGYQTLLKTIRDQDAALARSLSSQKSDTIHASPHALTPTIQKCMDNGRQDIQLVVFSDKHLRLTRKRKATQTLSGLRKLKIPYLIIPESTTASWQPRNIYIPLCLREGEKEASAWAGFWTRYHQSQLTLIYPVFKNPDQQRRLWMMLLFAERLLKRSNLPYQTWERGRQPKEILAHLNALAFSNDHNLIIFPATRFYSPEYYFTGPPEFHLLKNRGKTPVLFINPRNDLYIPCG